MPLNFAFLFASQVFDLLAHIEPLLFSVNIIAIGYVPYSKGFDYFSKL
jgi:hypothetical protein